MHFKRTKTYTDTHGNPQYSVRLVKNQRIGGKVKQTTMANLGTQWEVPQILWGPVAQRVEEIMAGQDPLMPCEPAVEQAAEEVVKLLRSRGIQTATPGPSVATVDLNTMEHRDPRFVGGERLCLHAWEELRLYGNLMFMGTLPP